LAEIEEAPKTAPVPPTARVMAEEEKRRKERERKQRQRSQQRDPAASHVANKTGGQPPPPPPSDDPKTSSPNPFASFRGSWARWTKKAGEPVGPIEAKRQLWHMHVAFARIIRSQVDFQEHEFEEAGGAFEEVANHWFPWLRIIVRIGAPLLLLGALIQIWTRMMQETPWWQEWRDRRRGQVMDVVPEYVGKEPIPQPAPFGDPSQPVPPADNGAVTEDVAHPPPIRLGRFRRR
jgi:hypothetical protein